MADRGMGGAALRAYLALVLFSIIGASLTEFLRLDAGPIGPIASALTILVGAWIVVRPARPLVSVLAAAGLGAASEIVGLATGWPFGRYAYTRAWAPTIPLGDLGRFPLMLPFAWLLIVGAAERLTRGLPPARAALSAGLAATAVDVLLEPVATGALGYWRWLVPGPLPGGAPWSNALGWFGVSAAAAAILRRGAAAPRSFRDAALVLLGYLALLGTLAALATLR